MREPCRRICTTCSSRATRPSRCFPTFRTPAPADAPLPFADQLGTQQFAAQLTHGGAPRVLIHNVIAPNFGDLNARLDEMEATARTGKVAAFKVYTAWGPNGQGFSLEDPAIGLPVIQKAQDLGVKIFVAHKGLPLVNFDPAHNGPDDIVAVSRQFPDMQFVVFHGAWDKSHVEGPYDPNATHRHRHVPARARRARCPAQRNVWVDLGTVWREVLRDPTTAAHTLGKLLKRVGEHRVLWGTDAIWYGSPQAQLQAFRAFTISNEFQDQFGYPALTETVKAQVLGLNAAKLFDLDVGRHPMCPRERPAHHRADHRRTPTRRTRTPGRVTTERPDQPTRDAPMARLTGHPLDASLNPAPATPTAGSSDVQVDSVAAGCE